VIGGLFAFAFGSIAYFWDSQGSWGMAVFFMGLATVSVCACLKGVCMHEAEEDERNALTPLLLCESSDEEEQTR
jgi:hypothetical protein